MKPALVLAVMTAACLMPPTGAALAQDATVPPPPAPPVAAVAVDSDWREVSAENLLVIDTTKGRILIELMSEIAPLHVERIKLLAGRGFYDGIPWHRVIDWFMAQTGDPLGTGDGQSPYPDLKAEFTFRRDAAMPFVSVAEPTGARVGFLGALPVQTQPDAAFALTSDNKVHGWGLYCPGVAGMARDEGNDTANSQFFIMRQAYPALDKRYTIWGMAVSGLDVVRSLKAATTPDGLVAEAPDRMIQVRVAARMPEAERPRIEVQSTSSTAFRQQVEATRTARGADFSVCDVTLPTRVPG